jgi:hypothetical protein
MMLLIAALLAVAGPATPAPDDDPVRDLAAAQNLYDQSCGVKGYAAYDDLCGVLRDQIHQAERAVDRAKAEKKKAAKAGARPKDASAPTQTAHK